MINQGSAHTVRVGPSWRVRHLVALLLAATALCALPAGAAEWVAPGAGNWFDPGNWDSGSVPSSSDVSFVGNGGTSQVTAGGDAVSEIVAIGSEAGNGAVEVGGAGSSLTIGSDLFLGDYSTGTLKVSAGGVVSIGNFAHIGYNPDSTGAATVSGAGSKLSMVFLELGYAGRGPSTSAMAERWSRKTPRSATGPMARSWWMAPDRAGAPASCLSGCSATASSTSPMAAR